MNLKANIQIHFIEEETGKIVAMEYACHVPRVDDEIRTGGKGNEKFHKVTRVVWVYDEEMPADYDRANVGVIVST